LKGLVLDTSALYYGKDLPAGYELAIPPGVVRELDKEGMGERLQLLLATSIRVFHPSKKSIDRVTKEAESTGDLARLSDTDMEVLALALELGYELVTDDYSIQNLARTIGVPCRGMEQKGISKVVEWQAKCTGCGKLLRIDQKICDVCGHPSKTRRKRGSSER